MRTQWLKSAKTDEERQKLKKTIESSKFSLDILRDIVYNIYISTISVSENDYEIGSWAYKQAHINGKREALTEILDLLDLDGSDPSHLLKKKALTDDRTNNIRTD